ncbi:hypothetical protein CERSUDRAFT_157745 [Gelatoporia subvermispora B]|uniref:DNA polymerase n=1 Tax=Ceriporiopsis subvermispora (strain B) TaxID=914234 RepID=M2PG81_CERS8|nr:hypothetical protein CERSUDRAFT_157745 [Gelatoporia subvermispora B]
MIDVRAAAHDPAKAGKSKAAVPGFKSRPKKSKELVTPLEYAQRLQAALTELGGRKNTSASQFLKGKRVFYYGRDLNFASAETRGRMELIVKHGGTLVPSYDPAQITHIVTDGAKRPLLRSLGLRTLEDIPGHIHIVKWSWITSGIGRMRYAGNDDELPQTDYEFMHASFSERMPPGPVPRFKAGFPPRTKAVSLSSRVQERPRNGAPSIRGGSVDGSDDSGEISHITNFTQDAGPKQRVSTPDHAGPSPLSPPLSPVHGSRSRVYSTCIVPPKASGPAHIRIPEDDKRSGKGEVSADDPLAEFYDHARAERDVELHQHNTNGDAEEGRTEKGEMLHKPGEAKNGKGGFLCDNKGNRSPDRCANQDVVEKLEQLMELHRTKSSMEDHWRVYSYGKAIRALRQHPRRITSYEQARGIDGVGDKTAQKIMEIISTGELRRLDFEKTDDAETITLFQGIYGVGLNTARKWYNRGCRTLQDLNEGKGGVQLSHVQQIGVNYYADINSRMPRAEATEIFERVKTIALRLDPRLFIEILGSYRRGEPDCGDIDVLITRPTDDGKTHRGLLRRLLGELHAQGILTEDLCLPDDFNDLELVYRGLCRRDAYSTRRRIDFLTIPYESRGAALLYYTSDPQFNRSLRMKANVMGFALNQRGLFAGVVRNPSDKRQKLSDGTCVASETEREIFRILGVPWQEPHERVRG